MMTQDLSVHDEVWLMLPWLANGRLAGGERARVEEHVRDCAQCAHELATQRLVTAALSAPERVSYAPGPSFRKLQERIDAAERDAPRSARTARAQSAAVSARTRLQRAWRPPGFAWAASFALALGLGATTMIAWHWSQPSYATYTSAPAATPGVLHIAFDRTVEVGAVEDALRTAGARVVTGPDASGIFGVAPRAGGAAQLRELETRLRADPRVRWVEPLPAP
jgi:hypothetical protein